MLKYEKILPKSFAELHHVRFEFLKILGGETVRYV